MQDELYISDVTKHIMALSYKNKIELDHIHYAKIIQTGLYDLKKNNPNAPECVKELFFDSESYPMSQYIFQTMMFARGAVHFGGESLIKNWVDDFGKKRSSV
ncbi:MAG TPA: hypothetical protein VJH34_02880 [archaeon]|nr:hypothetical protein [archaeon]